MTRIRRIGVKQTAKFFAVFYFVISLVFVIPFALIAAVAGTSKSSSSAFGLGGIFLIFVPVLYAVIGFIFVAIGSWVYNLIAKMTGGVEFEFEEKSESSPLNTETPNLVPPSSFQKPL